MNPFLRTDFISLKKDACSIYNDVAAAHTHKDKRQTESGQNTFHQCCLLISVYHLLVAVGFLALVSRSPTPVL